ncbi:hypothetical protein Desca_0076 [Desulfotomaculum nigrificans CO-1-SRB]|uniref:Uncharacterized protein n=1 Tax=Desulfotomaculum nigrificans (strain DSM 14880 / VKM B-2319 / CO-1-SRB) TaxID=868595 RepID=F6B4F8_DESCC|nr:hypothetical protein Desca_0076 [Desulfotomaculum nigrificans CO-1-SRB]
MGERSSNRLASNLEQLVSRIENAYAQRSSELEQVSGVLGNMDKLVDVMARVEMQAIAERQLNEKLERLNLLVEKLAAREAAATKEISIEETLRKVIKGVKVTGKVMDIVAGSLGIMVDSISAAVKSDGAADTTRGKTGTESVDLASVLSPIGSILQGLLGTEPVDSGQGKTGTKEEA